MDTYINRELTFITLIMGSLMSVIHYLLIENSLTFLETSNYTVLFFHFKITYVPTLH